MRRAWFLCCLLTLRANRLVTKHRCILELLARMRCISTLAEFPNRVSVPRPPHRRDRTFEGLRHPQRGHPQRGHPQREHTLTTAGQRASSGEPARASVAPSAPKGRRRSSCTCSSQAGKALRSVCTPSARQAAQERSASIKHFEAVVVGLGVERLQANGLQELGDALRISERVADHRHLRAVVILEDPVRGLFVHAPRQEVLELLAIVGLQPSPVGSHLPHVAPHARRVLLFRQGLQPAALLLPAKAQDLQQGPRVPRAAVFFRQKTTMATGATGTPSIRSTGRRSA